MPDQRRPFSLFAALALGIGAALIVLLLSGSPAAAAPAIRAADKPAPVAVCHARDDSAPGTIYNSGDASAVRQAVAAAVFSDVVRLAGTCNGAVAQLGTTQTVAITQPETLIGGFSLADWADASPSPSPPRSMPRARAG